MREPQVASPCPSSANLPVFVSREFTRVEKGGSRAAPSVLMSHTARRTSGGLCCLLVAGRNVAMRCKEMAVTAAICHAAAQLSDSTPSGQIAKTLSRAACTEALTRCSGTVPMGSLASLWMAAAPYSTERLTELAHTSLLKLDRDQDGLLELLDVALVMRNEIRRHQQQSMASYQQAALARLVPLYDEYCASVVERLLTLSKTSPLSAILSSREAKSAAITVLARRPSGSQPLEHVAAQLRTCATECVAAKNFTVLARQVLWAPPLLNRAQRVFCEQSLASVCQARRVGVDDHAIWAAVDLLERATLQPFLPAPPCSSDSSFMWTSLLAPQSFLMVCFVESWIRHSAAPELHRIWSCLAQIRAHHHALEVALFSRLCHFFGDGRSEISAFSFLGIFRCIAAEYKSAFRQWDLRHRVQEEAVAHMADVHKNHKVPSKQEAAWTVEWLQVFGVELDVDVSRGAVSGVPLLQRQRLSFADCVGMAQFVAKFRCRPVEAVLRKHMEALGDSLWASVDAKVEDYVAIASFVLARCNDEALARKVAAWGGKLAISLLASPSGGASALDRVNELLSQTALTSSRHSAVYSSVLAGRIASGLLNSPRRIKGSCDAKAAIRSQLAIHNLLTPQVAKALE